jgi:TetR/AcrR family transcriptional regulator
MVRNGSRKQQILEALTLMLETRPGEKITTAKLAEEVGVSEAALYRHFPSKVKMFEGLIIFIEDSLFTRINQITQEEIDCQKQLEKICSLVLIFAEKNPGLCRILTGEAISGDVSKLRGRIEQLFDRLNTELKQSLRQAEVKENFRPQVSIPAITSLLTAIIEGRIVQYVRSNYRLLPTENWDEQWQALSASLFTEKTSAFNR